MTENERRTALKKNEIIRIYGTEFKENTVRLLREAELASLIPAKDARIGIKPNLVSASEASFGATTHPEIVAGIIEYLKEEGFSNIVIAEGSWVGDKTSRAFELCGYRELSERYGVPLIDTQKDTWHKKDCGGMDLLLCDCADRFDFLINVPVLKGHCQTRVTCALKNMKGLLPNKEKRHFHAMGLHKPIAHLSRGIRQDFIVVDHICGDPDFEDGGNPLVRNCIMAGRDPVLIDTFGCSLMGIDPQEVFYIPMAEKLGSGSMDLAGARIRTIGEECGEEASGERRFVFVKDAVEEVESCSACYAYLMPALEKLQQEGLLANLPDKICIGQGWRGKQGKIGVGSCTSGFDFCVKGCPPTDSQIYEELKEYLQSPGS